MAPARVDIFVNSANFAQLESSMESLEVLRFTGCCLLMLQAVVQTF